MEEIIKLVANYTLLVVIAGLYLWDSISNKKKTSELEAQNNEILRQNTKCLEEMSKSNANISKSLEIIQENTRTQKDFLYKHDEHCQRTAENVAIVQKDLEFIKNRTRGVSMKEALKILLKNIANLFKVKTILSLCVIITTCILTFNGVVSVEAFMAIASAIITYYFTKKDESEEK